MASTFSVSGFCRRFPLATFCAAVWLILLAVVGYRFGLLAESQALLAEKEAEGKRLERNVANAVGLDRQTVALKSGLAALEARVIRIDNVGPNQQYFYDLEAASGVKVTILRQVAGTKSKVKSVLFRPAGYNVVAEGRYDQVMDFVRALETGTRHYRLADYTLQRGSQDSSADGTGGRVVLNLNLELLASL